MYVYLAVSDDHCMQSLTLGEPRYECNAHDFAQAYGALLLALDPHALKMFVASCGIMYVCMYVYVCISMLGALLLALDPHALETFVASCGIMHVCWYVCP